MLDNLLHNHTRTIIDGEGYQTVPATCAEVNRLIGSHVVTVLVDDGQGGLKGVRKVVSCADAETELAQLRQSQIDLTNEVGRLNGQVEDLTRERDNGVRLMANALQVIFGMGPALRNLLSDDLGAPELTSDRTAVKLECVQYSIVIDVFGERLIVCAANSDMPGMYFPVRDGRLDENSQKLLLGEVICIKTVAAGGENPVREAINLVASTAGAS